MNAKVRYRRRRRALTALKRKVANQAARTHVGWMYPQLRNVRTHTRCVRRNVAYVRAAGVLDGVVTVVECRLNVVL